VSRWGYFPEPSKSILIVQEHSKEATENTFKFPQCSSNLHWKSPKPCFTTSRSPHNKMLRESNDGVVCKVSIRKEKQKLRYQVWCDHVVLILLISKGAPETHWKPITQNNNLLLFYCINLGISMGENRKNTRIRNKIVHDAGCWWKRELIPWRIMTCITLNTPKIANLWTYLCSLEALE
jgi:hypothetical protein